MIIKPAPGGRLFWSVAAITMFGMACLGLAVFPPGLLLTCLALPIGMLGALYALGFSQTRIHNQGIASRNFFLITKYFKWAEIEEGKAYTQSAIQKDSSGWSQQKRKNLISFRKGKRWLHIDGELNTSETKDWWDVLIDMSKEKLGERFIDQR